MRNIFKKASKAIIALMLTSGSVVLWTPGIATGQDLEFGDLLTLPESQSNMEVFGYTSPNVAEVTGCWASFYVQSEDSTADAASYTTDLLLTSSQGLPSLLYEPEEKSTRFVGLQVGPNAFISFYSDPQGLEEEYRSEPGEAIEDLQDTYYWDETALVVMECIAK